MRLPLLFRRENSSPAHQEREERLERSVTEGLRRLADVLKKVADHIETRRLERRGYPKQERFLERTPPKSR